MSDYLTAILMVAITAGLCILALSCAMDCPYPREQLVQSYDYWTGAVRVRPFVTCGKE